MKRVKMPGLGMVVEFPYSCFNPYRQGWNGWVFRVGVIDQIYESNGNACVRVKYAKRVEYALGERETPVVYKEGFKRFVIGDDLFEFSGNVSSNEDSVFLTRNGLI